MHIMHFVYENVCVSMYTLFNPPRAYTVYYMYTFLLLNFIRNKGINIGLHMTYNNNVTNQSQIITLSLCL